MELTALNLLSCHKKHLNHECKRVSFYYILDVLFYLAFPPSVYEWNLESLSFGFTFSSTFLWNSSGFKNIGNNRDSIKGDLSA